MKNKKQILVVTGAGAALVAAAVLVFAVPALAVCTRLVIQGASGCRVTDAQGQVSCPMFDNQNQDATGDAASSGGACH
jgi:hypothetical protein